MIWWIIGTVVPSMIVAWAAGLVVRGCGPRFGLIDRPGFRKVHTRPMPTSGGLAIWLGIVLPLALGYAVLAGTGAEVGGPTGKWPWPAAVEPHLAGLTQQAGKLAMILAGGTVLMLLGLADDRFGLPWHLRLGVQALVAATVVFLEPRLRMTLFLNMPWVTAGLSVLWIVGLVNAFNMLDNMDGLSAGVAAIAAAILAAVMLLVPSPATRQPQLFIGGFLLVLLGALLGFLWHNRPPARLFMGDAGSYLIGYLLAVATLAATFAGASTPAHALLAPLCALAVPLYDMTTVIAIRLRQGRSPFVGDKSHFSHRLVELGMTHTQAVLTIWLAAATCGLGALLLHQVDTVGALVIGLMVGCVLVLVGILEAAGRKRGPQGPEESSSHGAH